MATSEAAAQDSSLPMTLSKPRDLPGTTIDDTRPCNNWPSPDRRQHRRSDPITVELGVHVSSSQPIGSYIASSQQVSASKSRWAR